jgi:hypothetical protein
MRGLFSLAGVGQTATRAAAWANVGKPGVPGAKASSPAHQEAALEPRNVRETGASGWTQGEGCVRRESKKVVGLSRGGINSRYRTMEVAGVGERRRRLPLRLVDLAFAFAVAAV